MSRSRCFFYLDNEKTPDPQNDIDEATEPIVPTTNGDHSSATKVEESNGQNEVNSELFYDFDPENFNAEQVCKA